MLRRAPRPPAGAATSGWMPAGRSGRSRRSWRSMCGPAGRRGPRSPSRRRVRPGWLAGLGRLALALAVCLPGRAGQGRGNRLRRAVRRAAAAELCAGWPCSTPPRCPPARPSGPAGDENPGRIASDIVFVLQEKPHPLFKRDGNDLIYTHRWGAAAGRCPTGVWHRAAAGQPFRLSLPPARPHCMLCCRPAACCRLTADPGRSPSPAPAPQAAAGRRAVRQRGAAADAGWPAADRAGARPGVAAAGEGCAGGGHARDQAPRPEGQPAYQVGWLGP